MNKKMYNIRLYPLPEGEGLYAQFRNFKRFTGKHIIPVVSILSEIFIRK